MKRRSLLACAGAGVLAFGCGRSARGGSSGTRIVVAGGAITEIVYALGAGSAVVGADTSSTYPPEAAALPKIGYQRQLASEGVLSLTPSLVVASDEAGPPDAIEQVRRAGVKVAAIASPKTAAAIPTRILTVGEAIDRQDRAGQVAAELTAAIADLEARAKKRTARPRVLFIYARGQGAMMVGGRNTPAEVVLALAGCENAASEIAGFLPLTPEAAVAARPDVVLAPAKGLESVGGPEGLFSTPGLADTPAAKSRRVVAIDDLLLLGLGPRVAQAIDELAAQVFA